MGAAVAPIPVATLATQRNTGKIGAERGLGVAAEGGDQRLPFGPVGSDPAPREAPVNTVVRDFVGNRVAQVQTEVLCKQPRVVTDRAVTATGGKHAGGRAREIEAHRYRRKSDPQDLPCQGGGPAGSDHYLLTTTLVDRRDKFVMISLLRQGQVPREARV